MAIYQKFTQKKLILLYLLTSLMYLLFSNSISDLRRQYRNTKQYSTVIHNILR